MAAHSPLQPRGGAIEAGADFRWWKIFIARDIEWPQPRDGGREIGCDVWARRRPVPGPLCPVMVATSGMGMTQSTRP